MIEIRDQHGADREVGAWLLTSMDGSRIRILSTSKLDHDLAPLVGGIRVVEAGGEIRGAPPWRTRSVGIAR